MKESPVSDRLAIEPLFASNERLWLRIWTATQATALVVAGYVLIENAGSVGAFVRGSLVGPAITAAASIIGYHIVGVTAYGRMMRRPWAVFVFVPLGWAIIVKALLISGAFGVLILGAFLQAFIFLPFAWGIATLALVVSLLSVTVAGRGGMQGGPLTVARVVGVLAFGTTFGTVMLYIHRANRDAAVRSRLLQQLDEAQRDLATRAKETGVLEERQRLAREIHDTIAQGFTSVIKHLETVELSFVAKDGTADDMLQRAMPHLANAQAVSRDSLAELRRLLLALRPPQLVETTLQAAIDRFVAQWSVINGIKVECVVADLPALRSDADVLFLRATQEALSNVARHAQASHVSVSLHCVDGLVLLSVEDDGRGFADPEADTPGKMGIAGMRERVRPFGGRVLIESTTGEGTSLTVAVPFAEVAMALV
jgi:signal transduction histidine kinase